MGSRWQLYGTLLLMPLRVAGALTLLFLAGCITLMLKMGLFAIPGLLMAGTWYFKYSFAYLDAMVAGHTEAPVLSAEMIMASLDEFRFLLPLILCILAFFAFGAANYFIGPLPAVLLGVVMLLVLPAVLAVQGWTCRLAHSVDPVICLRMVRALGTDYVRLLGCVSGLVALCALVRSVPGSPMLLRVFVALYAWLGTMGVIGGTLRLNRERLSEKVPLVVPEIAPESLDALTRERQKWLDSMYGPLRADNRDGVWQLLMERLQKAEHPLLELHWLYDRIADWRPLAFPNRVAQELISRLLVEDREGEALRLVRERLTRDASFRPLQAQEAQRLAQLAERWRDHPTVEALKKAFPVAA